MARSSRLSRRQFRLTLLGAAAAVLVALALARPDGRRDGSEAQRGPTARLEASAEPVARLCADCHAYPPPETFPRVDWPREVERGYDFYYRSNRDDIPLPPMQHVINYYQRRAPEDLEFPTTTPPDTSPVRFHPQPFGSGEPAQAAVAHIRYLPSHRMLVWCDMGTGAVMRADLQGNSDEPIDPELLIQLSHPCHVEATDLDGDEKIDFVVADLGSFLPEDHDRGQTLWIHQSAEDGTWAVVPLCEKLGRVADVRPGDFDSDGDLDLIVAEFGWLDTGSIRLLENRGRDANGDWQFDERIIDQRHGAIHVPVADLDGDGRLDFVALISQEHEIVEAFLNRGNLEFERRPIFSAEDPSFGSSGIELVDLDQDGDLDVLSTNGDSFDSALPKPYHAVHWLENRGDFPFVHRQLTAMPGVHRARAGDLDRDGDLDVVAVALLSNEAVSRYPDAVFDSIVWLEQTRPGEFKRHALETGQCDHAVCELAELDGDGDLDLIVGHYRLGHRLQTSPAALTVWWNQSER